MDTFFSGISGSAFLFIVTLGSGIWLSHSGNPYPTVIFNIHKLVAVGAIFIIVRNIYHLQQVAPARAFVGPSALAIIGILFAALVISGGLLSVQNAGLLTLKSPVLNAVHTVHQVTPMLALLFAGLSLALLIDSRAA